MWRFRWPRVGKMDGVIRPRNASRSVLARFAANEKETTNHNRANTGPDGNVDVLFFVKRHVDGTYVSLMGRFRVAEPAIGEPQDACDDKHYCCQLAGIHTNFSLPSPPIALASFQRKATQLPQVQRSTAKQSDESNGNQVKSDYVVQQPWNDQN